MCGGFKQGTCRSKEQWSAEVKGVQDACKSRVATLKTWFSVNIEAMVVRFCVWFLMRVMLMLSKS